LPVRTSRSDASTPSHPVVSSPRSVNCSFIGRTTQCRRRSCQTSLKRCHASPTGGDQRVSTSALRGFVGSYLIEWVDYVLHDRLCMLATTMYRDKFSFLCPRTGLS
jgi:hypothetical protein